MFVLSLEDGQAIKKNSAFKLNLVVWAVLILLSLPLIWLPSRNNSAETIIWKEHAVRQLLSLNLSLLCDAFLLVVDKIYAAGAHHAGNFGKYSGGVG